MSLKVQKFSISEIKQDPRNARLHSDRNLFAIKTSLRKFGQQKPIVIDNEYVIKAGNGTFQAAKELGWSEIDAVVTELTEEQANAYAIADNRSGELAGWDPKALESLVEDLGTSEYNISDLGFTEEELEKLISPIYNPTLDPSFTSHLTSQEEIDAVKKNLEEKFCFPK